jgi:hypothetical protein
MEDFEKTRKMKLLHTVITRYFKEVLSDPEFAYKKVSF